MERFRQNNLRPYLSMCVLLSLLFALFCDQGAKLHAHLLDHEYSEHLSSEYQHTENSPQGEYLSAFHSVHDLSHSEHHDEIVYEVGDDSDKALKSTSTHPSALELFVFSFLFLLVCPVKQTIPFLRESRSDFYYRHLLVPPLRAPPR